ncbi:MAG: SDR family oxidoreductase, partial [Bacteroidia bacterium]|nr:SDR family oxidoreductase [Bacteroidia bacterium]
MELLNLFEKKILITGASSGIGKHAAITASRHGAEVIITGRNETRLQDTLKQMQGKGHKMIVADISSEKNIDELIEKLTVINGLVHCAGIIHPLPVKFITQKHINEMYSINYHAPVLLTSKLLKAKKIAKGGSIVFLSSISSRFGHIGGALYGGTKAG